MAKLITVKYLDAFDGQAIIMDLSAIEIISKSSKKVVVDSGLGFTFAFEGSNLKVKDGIIVSGTITSKLIADPDGKDIVDTTGLNIDVSKLDTSSLANVHNAINAFNAGKDIKLIGMNLDDDQGQKLTTSTGDDIILGRKGDDLIDGMAGDDTLTGNQGFDTFYFAEGYDKDTITDFDAKGGRGNQDLIHAVFDDVLSVKDKNGDAVINFGGGDTLTLLDVKADLIGKADFYLPPE